jgi:hypothetical protein
VRRPATGPAANAPRPRGPGATLVVTRTLAVELARELAATERARALALQRADEARHAQDVAAAALEEASRARMRAAVALASATQAQERADAASRQADAAQARAAQARQRVAKAQAAVGLPARTPSVTSPPALGLRRA